MADYSILYGSVYTVQPPLNHIKDGFHGTSVQFKRIRERTSLFCVGNKVKRLKSKSLNSYEDGGNPP
jgi:hypothetical protein